MIAPTDLPTCALSHETYHEGFKALSPALTAMKAYWAALYFSIWLVSHESIESIIFLSTLRSQPSRSPEAVIEACSNFDAAPQAQDNVAPIFADYTDPPSASDSSIVDEPYTGANGTEPGPADALLNLYMDPPLTSVTCASNASAYKVNIFSLQNPEMICSFAIWHGI